MQISPVGVLGVLLVPEVLQDDGVSSRQPHATAELLRLFAHGLAHCLALWLRYGAVGEVIVLTCRR